MVDAVAAMLDQRPLLSCGRSSLMSYHGALSSTKMCLSGMTPAPSSRLPAGISNQVTLPGGHASARRASRGYDLAPLYTRRLLAEALGNERIP